MLLIAILVVVWNRLIECCIVVRSPIPPLVNINTPSTKRRCVIVHHFVILIPISLPLRCISLISMLRPSITSRKSSGDKGHPYLSPFLEDRKEKKLHLS